MLRLSHNYKASISVANQLQFHMTYLLSLLWD